jgi:hypothetical protein
MEQRDEAPLDEITTYMTKKLKETKVWLHELCIEDGKTSSNTRHRRADSNLAMAEQHEGNVDKPPCVSGYEELEQRGSMESSAWLTDSSAPQSQENLARAPQTCSTLLSGSPRQVPVEVEIVSRQSTAPHDKGLAAGKSFTCSSIHQHLHVNCTKEPKSEAAFTTQKECYGPSVVGVRQEAWPTWQQGEKVEVWSVSMQCWFEGMIIEPCIVDSVVDGCQVPRGSYKVAYSGDTVKWILPHQVQDVMRPLSRMSGI